MKVKFDVNLDDVHTLKEDKNDDKYLLVGIANDLVVKTIDRVKMKYNFIPSSTAASEFFDLNV